MPWSVCTQSFYLSLKPQTDASSVSQLSVWKRARPIRDGESSTMRSLAHRQKSLIVFKNLSLPLSLICQSAIKQVNYGVENMRIMIGYKMMVALRLWALDSLCCVFVLFFCLLNPRRPSQKKLKLFTSGLLTCVGWWEIFRLVFVKA